MLEAALVTVLSVILWIILSPGMPVSHGASPLVKTRYVPFRFSVRTLLIAMTLAAVVLGILVWIL